MTILPLAQINPENFLIAENSDMTIENVNDTENFDTEDLSI